ncbi:hypothetical protein D3C71_2067360 [compost metagenome]
MGIHLKDPLAAKGFQTMFDRILYNRLHRHLRNPDRQPLFINVCDNQQPAFQPDRNNLQVVADLLQFFLKRDLRPVLPLTAVTEHGRQ